MSSWSMPAASAQRPTSIKRVKSLANRRLYSEVIVIDIFMGLPSA